MTRESKPSNVSATTKMVRCGKWSQYIHGIHCQIKAFTTQVFAYRSKDNGSALPLPGKLYWQLCWIYTQMTNDD